MLKEIKFYWKIVLVLPAILLLLFTKYEFSLYYLIVVFSVIFLVEKTNIFNSKKVN